VIDLHSHVLPGLDDGPEDLAGAVDLAMTAALTETRVLVATPHIREDHPFPLQAIGERVDYLNRVLTDLDVALKVVPGAEVAITKAAELDTETLRGLCLGDSPYLLVESPYTHAPALLERVLGDLQHVGLKPVLAHPERSPAFIADPVRLERIVQSGVLCSVTALSLAGGFGGTVQRFAAQLFVDGLVHDVASDAHDTVRRPPGISDAFHELDALLPGARRQASWFTTDAPRAILAGEDLPPRPAPLEHRARGLRSLLSGLPGRAGRALAGHAA
jgi:protein-tyrosine phosphatase